MAALAAVRSLVGSCAHTCRLATVSMLGPPCYAGRLEDRNQLFNSSCSQDRGLGTRLGRTISAHDGNVANLTRNKLNLAVPEMARQTGKSKKS